MEMDCNLKIVDQFCFKLFLCILGKPLKPDIYVIENIQPQLSERTL